MFSFCVTLNHIKFRGNVYFIKKWGVFIITFILHQICRQHNTNEFNSLNLMFFNYNVKNLEKKQHFFRSKI